jgi:hypothetical protein
LIGYDFIAFHTMHPGLARHLHRHDAGGTEKVPVQPDYKLVCTLKDISFEDILDMAKSVLKQLLPIEVQ